MSHPALSRFAFALLAATSLGFAACAREAAPEPGAARPAPADTVFRGGAVYTAREDGQRASAVAVRDGVIVAVGGADEVDPLTGPDTEIVDIGGGLLLPGFHDAHVHLIGGGLQSLRCSLADLLTVEAILAKVAECAAEEGAPGEWLVGRGWNLGLFPNGNPQKSLLDEIVPDRPVYLEGEDGHSAWVNSKALELAGIDAGTPDPALGVIERDPATGEPTGTLRETAMGLVEPLLPAVGAETRLEALKAGVAIAHAEGITSIIEAAARRDELETYAALADAGELDLRVVASIVWGEGIYSQGGDFEALLAERERYRRPTLAPDAIKIFVDGVLEGETAALLEPYLGPEPHSGVLNVEPAALAAAVTRFDGLGLQVHMHVIGDRATRVALDAVAAARGSESSSGARHHLAHAQLIHPEDVPRFAALDATANFQMLWAFPDEYIVDINLPAVGPERVERMYPVASVLEAGGRVVGGSDWPVSTIDPMKAIEVAVTREDYRGLREGVLNAGERIALETALAAYTREAAWLMGQLDRTGTIEVGKAADLVLLERDPFAVEPSALGGIEVAGTWFEGRRVHPASR